MSVVLNVQVNVSALVAALEESFPSALDERVPIAIQQVGEVMQADAQTRAPKRTGYMASNIIFERVSYSDWAFRLVGRAPYTIYQELGTRYIHAHLFMMMSVEFHMQDMIQAIREAAQEAISDAFGT